MGIAFSTIEANIRTNTHHVEFDASRALTNLTAVKPHRVLVAGIKLSTGTVAELIPKQVISADGSQSDAFWGLGSQISEMIRAAKLANETLELWGIGIDELSGGTAGTTTVTFTGTATATGTIHMHIAGHYVPVAIASGDAATAVATKVDTAIKAHAKYTRMPFTSGAASSVVTLTMRWKGVDQAPVVVNYNDEELPAGIASAVVAEGVAGAGNPDIGEIITAIAAEQFDTIIVPWNDATNYAALNTELAARYGGGLSGQNEGCAFIAYSGTHAATTTFGNSMNSKHITCMATNVTPTPSWIWAAADGMVDASEPVASRPRQTLPIPGVLPAKRTARWTDQQRNLLLYDGLATHTVDQAGQCYVERHTTTYQTNAQSVADPTFLDVTTLRTLYAIRYSRRTAVSRDFPRHLLGEDGADQPVGLPIVTPNSMKAHGVAQFISWANAGWVSLSALPQFIDEYQVIQDPTNVNRLQELMPPKLMNQFRGLSGQVQFLLA